MNEVFIVTLRCALYQVGRFEAKLYFQTEDGELLWPKGTNSIIKVEPADTTAQTPSIPPLYIYLAKQNNKG